jgi:hypothetical protein
LFKKMTQIVAKVWDKFSVLVFFYNILNAANI